MSEEAIYGVWAGAAASDLEQTARRLDLDYFVADLQHGTWTFGEMERLFANLGERESGRCRPWVRTNLMPSDAEVGHCLDAGAWGLIVPYAASAEQLRAVRGAMRYPPDGRRSFGRNVGMINTRVDSAAAYRNWSRQSLRLLALVESAAGLDRLEEIAVAADGVLFGLEDLALDLGESKENCLQRIERRLSTFGIASVGYLGIDTKRQQSLGATIVNFGNVKDFLGETIANRYRELGLRRTTQSNRVEGTVSP